MLPVADVAAVSMVVGAEDRPPAWLCNPEVWAVVAVAVTTGVLTPACFAVVGVVPSAAPGELLFGVTARAGAVDDETSP